MRIPNFRRALILAGLISLTVVYSALWLRMIGDRAERTGADFIAFYAAGQIARAEGPDHVYDPALQQAVQAAQVGFALAPGQVLLYNHVPYLIPLLRAVVNGDYAASFARWALVLVAVTCAGIAVLGRLLVSAGYERGPVLLAAAGSALFFPVFAGLLNGQDTAFLFLGAVVWTFGLLTGRDRLAGLGLSLTTVRPHVALILALPFLFHRRRVFGWFVVGATALGLVSVLILGRDGTQAFVDLLLVSAGGNWYGMKEPEMFNLIGLLFRLAPGLGEAAIRAIGWGAFLLAIAGLCLLWLRAGELTEAHLGLAVIVTIFAVPHLHFHDLALLLLPIHGLIRRNRTAPLLADRDAVLLPLAASVLLLVGNFAPILKYTIPYLLMALLATALWFPDKLGAVPRRTT